MSNQVFSINKSLHFTNAISDEFNLIGKWLSISVKLLIV